LCAKPGFTLIHQHIIDNVEHFAERTHRVAGLITTPAAGNRVA